MFSIFLFQTDSYAVRSSEDDLNEDEVDLGGLFSIFLSKTQTDKTCASHNQNTLRIIHVEYCGKHVLYYHICNSIHFHGL